MIKNMKIGGGIMQFLHYLCHVAPEEKLPPFWGTRGGLGPPDHIPQNQSLPTDLIRNIGTKKGKWFLKEVILLHFRDFKSKCEMP